MCEDHFDEDFVCYTKVKKKSQSLWGGGGGRGDFPCPPPSPMSLKMSPRMQELAILVWDFNFQNHRALKLHFALINLYFISVLWYTHTA